MTSDSFRDHLDRLRISHGEFCRIFQLADERTSRRWAAGEKAVPWSVAAVLVLARRLGLDAKALAQLQV